MSHIRSTDDPAPLLTQCTRQGEVYPQASLAGSENETISSAGKAVICMRSFVGTPPMAASPLFFSPLCSSKLKVSLLKDPCVSWRPEGQRTSSGAKRMALSCSSIGSDPRFDQNLRAQSSMAAFSLTEDEVLMPKRSFQWQRVLLKVSGEALAGDRSHNVDPEITMSIAREVAAVTRLGVEVAIVVGGGNFFRGSSWAGCSGLDRSSADHIGMLATVMNAIFLQATMESIGIPTRVQTAFRMSEVAEPYIRRRAIRHLEKGRVVIFAAGTGNPFFTTDTAAALRCAEINAEVVLKATNVDGVYDDDPRTNPNARLHDTLSYHDVTSKDLSVMDLTAITLCQENNIPVVVFNLSKPGNITKAIMGQKVGTMIGGSWDRVTVA
ncbi:uridylate kinase PUMPKIN, chloroplastic [Nymphaea colorata]|nr:uridylate kinase PUMPKIN, chloroplastic [Nymphaea colorata]